MSKELINKGISVVGDGSLSNHRRIIVIGTARGGTSMAAGALAKLGVFMGDRASAPVYEDVRLSEAFESKNVDLIRQISEEYSSKYSTWGWKRPSSIDYLGMVDDILEKPIYIILYKDIFSIAQRNAISMLNEILPGMQRAVNQYQQTINFLGNKQPYALLVSYDKSVSEPEYFVDALIDFCGLSPSKEERQDAINFITPNPVEYLDATRITKAEGQLVGLVGRTVIGWARYVHTKQEALVNIFVDGVEIGTTIANKEIKDLQTKCDTPCGFVFEVSDKIDLNQSSEIRCRVENDVNDLKDSPTSVSELFKAGSNASYSLILPKIPLYVLSEDASVHVSETTIAHLRVGNLPAIDKLGKGWNAVSIWEVENGTKILILEKENQKAFWYFNKQNIFIGNSFKNIYDVNPSFKSLFFLLLLRILKECILPKENNDMLFRDGGDFLFAEFSAFCNIINQSAIHIGNMPESVWGHVLSASPADVQDSILREVKPQILIKLDDRIVKATRGIVINNVFIAYPMLNAEAKLCAVLFTGGRDGDNAMVLDLETMSVYYQNRAGNVGKLLSDFIMHMKGFWPQLHKYFNLSDPKEVIAITRNEHIGHRLWNDLSGLFRVRSNNLSHRIDHLVHFDMSNIGEVWMKAKDVLKRPILDVELAGGGKTNLSTFVYNTGAFPVRIADRYLPENLINEIVDYCVNNAKYLTPVKEKQELRVVFGLRFENRTWTNQNEGFAALACHLGKSHDKVTLIIDGHDRMNGTKILSHWEHAAANDIVSLEKSVVASIQSALKEAGLEHKVTIIDAVDMDIYTTMAWICSADFFVAPWGAGLTKYKWVANLKGLIFSSKEVMSTKGDLKIYEDPGVREGATECTYLDYKYVVDITEPIEQICKVPEGGQMRGNFVIDIEGLIETVDQLTATIGNAQ